MCEALSRHGVDCTLRLDPTPANGVGPTLLAMAERRSAELLVMGGDGHSRLREIIFGGVTRCVLQQKPLPVLLSH